MNLNHLFGGIVFLFTILLFSSCTNNSKNDKDSETNEDKKPYWERKKEGFSTDKFSFLKQNEDFVKIKTDSGGWKKIKRNKDDLAKCKLIAYSEKIKCAIVSKQYKTSTMHLGDQLYHFIKKENGKSFVSRGLPIISPNNDKLLFCDEHDVEGPLGDKKGGFHVVDISENTPSILISEYAPLRRRDPQWGISKGEWINNNVFEVVKTENNLSRHGKVVKIALAPYWSGHTFKKKIKDGSIVPNK